MQLYTYNKSSRRSKTTIRRFLDTHSKKSQMFQRCTGIYRHDPNPTSLRYIHQGCGHFDYGMTLPDPVDSDIPYFGKVLLAMDESGATTQEWVLHDLIRRYAVGDVDPLFQL